MNYSPITKSPCQMWRPRVRASCDYCGYLPWEHDFYGSHTPGSELGGWTPRPWMQADITDWLARGTITPERAAHLASVKAPAKNKLRLVDNRRRSDRDT